MSEPHWQPRIVAFFCNWCTYTAADLAGVSRLSTRPTSRVIRLMCSGRVDPQFMLDALAQGRRRRADRRLPPGDCHYVEGNYKMPAPVSDAQALARDMGIEDRSACGWNGSPPPKARR